MRYTRCGYSTRRGHRRGLALLVVLAFACLLVTVTAGLASRGSMARLRIGFDRDGLIADSIREALERPDGPIQRWLTEESANIVLPPDVERPTVTVLHDRLVVGERHIETFVTAWDQCGVVPFTHLDDGSRLRAALPTWVRETAAHRARARSSPPTGLDEFIVARERISSLAVFPVPTPSDVDVFTTFDADGAPPALRIGTGHRGAGGRDARLALGDFVGFRGDGVASINVNTAPLPLIEAALRALGRGGLDLIRAARELGERAPTGGANDAQESAEGVGGRGDPGPRIELVGQSDRWCLRLDIIVDRVAQSWWTTYERGHTRDDGPAWVCTQRLLVTE